MVKQSIALKISTAGGSIRPTSSSSVIRINREKVPNIFQLSAYAKSLREYVGDELEDQDGEPYSVDRLSAGLAVGDNNGDVIFLDAEDSYSVWMFHHDGADVERLANSFHEWLEAAKPYTFDDENEDDGDEENDPTLERIGGSCNDDR